MLNVTAAICRFLFCENRLSLLYNKVGRFFSLTLSICKLFEVPLGTNQFYWLKIVTIKRVPLLGFWTKKICYLGVPLIGFWTKKNLVLRGTSNHRVSTVYVLEGNSPVHSRLCRWTIPDLIGNLSYIHCSEPSRTVLLLNVRYTTDPTTRVNHIDPPVGRSIIIPPCLKQPANAYNSKKVQNRLPLLFRV